jgi:hypothetical protein
LIFDKQPESNKSDAVNSGSETGQESMSWQAGVPWCSSCNGLMGRKGRWTLEANYFIYSKRVGVIAKLATS